MFNENTHLRVVLCEIKGGARDGIRLITLIFHDPASKEITGTFGMEVPAAEAFMADVYREILRAKEGL